MSEAEDFVRSRLWRLFEFHFTIDRERIQRGVPLTLQNLIERGYSRKREKAKKPKKPKKSK